MAPHDLFGLPGPLFQSLSDLQHAARTSIESGDRIAGISDHGAYFAPNLTTATYVKSPGGATSPRRCGLSPPLVHFADGRTSALQNRTHVFTTPGDYNAVLQVTDPNSTDSSIEKEAYIVVQ